ncbi:tRNA uridine-5-carboxymethylaminomethyl(34) synthesis GTPase MnmE [Chlamydia sp. 17-3921]|uniref:tRNA uridine-5-carboxymethylaminomethyl(34) synthesis GTPase MnmE n=1 Tax=Chlamydia sp. 17-3921 TaxID=2675798 RepID=UPI00191A153A|nr:tRNA uridine-5-carboxymethylaminomethyl(34) synthesis GTPase MnmE [Chlamydia sp. 17-3921]
MLTNDTIAAIATPPGEGGIAIVRISGPEAILIADRIFSGNVTEYASHTAHLGDVFYQNTIIDQALLLIMRSPKSFTGEDVIEFQCHGGYFACTQILESVFTEGARAALPGEFSQRAFLNGKIDLIQAEAIQNLIAADNLDAFRIAQEHFQGAFSKKVQEITNLIFETLAFIEVLADFPEEEQPSLEIPKQNIQKSLDIVANFLDSFNEGQRLAQGTTIILAGEPNVGKSSLLNALVQKNRAIVSDIPGTTRDILEEAWLLQGKRIRLIDTAGQRTTNDYIENEGINRAIEAMKHAERILWVIDSTRPCKSLPEILFSKPSFLIWNKADLATPPKLQTDLPQFTVSTKTGKGLTELKRALQQWIQCNPSGKNSKIFLVSSRHYTIFKTIHQCLVAAQENLSSQLPPEFVAQDLRHALHSIGNLSGSEVTENILGEIFSRFCIGK